jgi:prolyl oligopeptidase
VVIEFPVAVFLRPYSWRQITKFEDKVKTGVLGFGHEFYAISLQDAPRGKLVQFALDVPVPMPDVIVPESETVVKAVVATTNELLIQTMEGGPSGLYAYGLDGSNRKTVPIPPISFGHGIGSSLDQQVTDLTDVFSFFAYELGKACAPPVNSVAGTES